MPTKPVKIEGILTWAEGSMPVTIEGDMSFDSLPSETNNFLMLSLVEPTEVEELELKFGRPFKRGEIPDFPEVLIDDVAVLTQAHVETRWDDGSARTAVFFLHVPHLTQDKVKITFQNQSNSNTESGMSVESALDSEFDAEIKLALNGVEKSTSARTMMQNGHVWTLYSGAVATEFIIEDHSESQTYDIGFEESNQYKPFRPIFHATFWSKTNRVEVRFIGEMAKTTEATNMPVGEIVCSHNGQVIKTKDTPTDMQFASRWSVKTPSVRYNLNHNLKYLASTGLIPNWDPERVLPESKIAAYYESYLAKPRDLYQSGFLYTSMPAPGGRHDIGMAPGWIVWWLYTGDSRMLEICESCANLAGAWPMHYRESQHDRILPFSESSGVNAGGRVLSINSRRTVFLWHGFNGAGVTLAADKIKQVGPCNANGWNADCAHQPDPYTILYLLTGDYFSLEQAWFWASYSAAYFSPANIHYGHRGPNGKYGGMAAGGEPRTCAWPFRSRCQIAAYTPERFVEEKDYFTKLTNDAIVLWEGISLLESPESESELYKWGASWKLRRWPPAGEPNPFGYWTSATGTDSPAVIDYNVTAYVCSAWMHHFMICALGVGRDLGFRVGPLLDWASKYVTERVKSGQIPPFTMAAYRDPAKMKPNPPADYFPDWAGIFSGYNDSYDYEGVFNASLFDTTHGYANIAMAASAFCNDKAVWDWIEEHARTEECLARLDADPKWAFLPKL